MCGAHGRGRPANPARPQVMARRANDPTAELASLHEKRVELAQRRDAHATAEGAAQRTVEGSPDRRRAALVAEARGEKPSETAEAVDRERHAAEVALVDNRERAAALTLGRRRPTSASERPSSRRSSGRSRP